MARSDLLLALVRAAVAGDSALVTQVVEALAAEERAKRHGILADRLEETLRANGKPKSTISVNDRARSADLVTNVAAKRRLEDLVLTPEVETACRELVEEQHRADLLRSYSLEPRHRVLLMGPPGNGKTSLAEALAEALSVPFFVVRYDAVIDSYLGETATRLRSLFEFAKTHRCVLFFDEFDTLGKERGDTHEAGEIKRVVSSLLMQLDGLPSYVVAVAASNHPELFDRAVWRRFQIRLQLPPPTRAQIVQWFEAFQSRIGEPLGLAPRTLADKLRGLNFSEIEEFATDSVRRWVLSRPERNLREVIRARLVQWRDRVREARDRKH